MMDGWGVDRVDRVRDGSRGRRDACKGDGLAARVGIDETSVHFAVIGEVDTATRRNVAPLLPPRRESLFGSGGRRSGRRSRCL